MWFIVATALFTMAFFMGFLWKEDFCDTLPLTVGMTILLLYVLAFFRMLSAIDVISIISIVTFFLFVWFQTKEKRNEVRKSASHVFLHPQTILFLILIIFLTICTKDRVASWWDDINYWATDVKGLYYLNGFASKYGNVAPEFGDYPPAVQLFKWLFLHFSPNEYKEGLAFSGYYCLNVILLLPILRTVKSKNIILQFIACFSLFLLPGVVNGIYFTGTCSDITMGIAYGALLWSIWDTKEHTVLFYYIRIAVYAGVLVLTKSVGIEWMMFAFLFLLMIQKGKKENGDIVFQMGTKKARIAAFLFPLLIEGSWLLFCLVCRRVAKLTSAGIRLAMNGNLEFLKNATQKAGYYFKGFTLYPMHSEKTWAIDLSSLAFLLIIGLLILFLGKKKIIQKEETKRLLLFGAITAFAAYGIIFLGHITIFAGELQYLDASVMALSIARYGAPFTLGWLYLLIGIMTQQIEGKRIFLYILLAILITTNYPGAYMALQGYRDNVAKQVEDNRGMIDKEAEKFVQLVENEKELWGKRVLYLRNDHEIHWVKDTYISYEVSPVAVIYKGIATDTMTKEDMTRQMNESHASYLYADCVPGDPQPLFNGIVLEEPFEYGTLYRMIQDNKTIRLERVKGLSD